MRKVRSVQATDFLDVFFRIIDFIIADIFLSLDYILIEQDFLFLSE